MTTHITDHKSAALARLAQQFKGKTNVELFMGVFANRYQGVEDALWQLYTERWLDTAIGVQLDVLGHILKQPRGNSVNDEAYRLRLRARQRVNRSSGTIEQLLSVFKALEIEASHLWVEPAFPAGLTLHLSDLVVDEDTATLYAEFLRAARDAAVRATLHTSEYDAAHTFTLPASAVITREMASGSTDFIDVGSTARFPASGTIVVSVGTANEEEVFYNQKTATRLFGDWIWALDHDAGDLVMISPTAAQALSSTSTPSVGGHLSTIQEA